MNLDAKTEYFWEKPPTPNLLTKRIADELRANYTKNLRVRFKDWREQIYYPSRSSLTVIVAGCLICLALSHIPTLGFHANALDFLTSAHFGDLIAIQAGVGTVIFGLMVLIAQSLKDDHSDKARVLLKTSYLYPLTIIEILVFLNFLWGTVNIWSVVPIAIVGLLTVGSVYRLIEVMLSKYKFEKEREKILTGRIIKGAELAIDERIGNNILLKSLGEKGTDQIELTYYPSTPPGYGRDFYAISSSRVGLIQDVDMGRLKTFAKKVEEIANKSGYSFYKEKPSSPLPSVVVGGSLPEDSANEKKYQRNKSQYLAKKYRDVIDDDNRVIFYLDKKTIKDPEVIKELEKLAQKIFVIGTINGFSEEIHAEIEELQDNFIQAIRDARIAQISRYVETIIDLAEAFLKIFVAYGGGYTYEQARKETSDLFGGWDEVKWLRDLAGSTFLESMKTHDKEIITPTAYLSIAIAIRAIQRDEQYTFQQFFRFVISFYAAALKEHKPSLKEYMLDRSSRWIKEMSDYYIEPQLREDAQTKIKIEHYGDFAIHLFVTIQDLMKLAYQNHDLESFKTFARLATEVCDGFHPETDINNSERYSRILQSNILENQRAEIQTQLDLQLERERVNLLLKTKRQEMLFGVAAWLLSLHRKNLNEINNKRFYEAIDAYTPTDISKLTELFLTAIEFRRNDFWGWDWWDLVADGQVHSIDSRNKFQWLFLIKALQILSGMPDDLLDKVELPHNRDISYMAQEQGELTKILDNFLEHPKDFVGLVTDQMLEKVPVLKLLLQKTIIQQEKAEKEEVQNAVVNPTKKAEFISNIKKSFNRSARIRQIMNAFRNYKNLTSNEAVCEEPKLWGINQLDDKEAFIKDWHVHYSAWGENYGHGLANAEDKKIFEAITLGIETSATTQLEKLPETLSEKIRSLDLESPIVLASFDFEFRSKTIPGTSSFHSYWSNNHVSMGHDGITGYLGYFELGKLKLPVFEFPSVEDEPENTFYLLSASHLATFIQYPPMDKSADEQYRDEIFYIKIVDLNEDAELREQLIQRNPGWLQNEKDKEGYLKQKVVINLYEKYEFKILDPSKGIVIKIDAQ